MGLKWIIVKVFGELKLFSECRVTLAAVKW